MKSTLALLAIIFTSISTTVAQDLDEPIPLITVEWPKPKLDIRNPIMSAIARCFNSEELFKIKKNYGRMMALGVSFDSDGRVDSVYFSKKLSPEVSKIFNPNVSATKKVAERLKPYTDYKNTVVIFPVLFFDMNSEYLDYSSGVLNHLNGMWPELSTKDKKKTLVLLDTFLNQFHPPIH